MGRPQKCWMFLEVMGFPVVGQHALRKKTSGSMIRFAILVLPPVMLDALQVCFSKPDCLKRFMVLRPSKTRTAWYAAELEHCLPGGRLRCWGHLVY